MTNLVHKSISSIGSLREYLADILPTSILTEVEIDSTYQPILLMQTEHGLAAFAFSSNDVNDSYNALYSGFKNFYSVQQGKWDNFDLAFVLCVQPGSTNLDNFCSKVETDVYFCRKFVVLLNTPLSASLARLPFLPLTPLNGQTMRPASAQTFLQKCSVPAMLAKNIVVQRDRSPDGIVEDVTNGKFGEPQELEHVLNTQVAQPDRDTESVRLESVTIENFRAYRRPQTFEIGSHVTVLYGPNGFGKTSFFDAVDFAVTGGIGRFESSSDAPFAKTVRHLDCNDEEGVVKLSFSRNGVMRKITRCVSERKQALLDDQPTDRKSILTELTSGSIPAADRVENFVNLFRATHLFSQEQQELTKDFQKDCRLSVEIVSRMLAFEDYVNAVNKAGKVSDVLRSVITKANKEIVELSKQIKIEEIELSRLDQTAKAHTNIKALEEAIEELRDKVEAAGITVLSQKPDAAVLRGWRASLEVRHAEGLSRIDKFSKLIKEVAGQEQITRDILSLQAQHSQKEKELGEAEAKKIGAEEVLRLAEQNIAKKNAQCSARQSRATLFEWIHTTKPVYAQLRSRQQSILDKLEKATDSLNPLRKTEEKQASELRTKKSFTSLVFEKLETKRTELTTVQGLNESTFSWLSNQRQLAVVAESELSETKSLELLRTEARVFSEEVTAVAAEEAGIARKITEVDKNQSELKGLLSQMQEHVRTGTCPLCGEDHGSKDKLAQRIQKHLDIDAASDARSKLTGILEQASQLAGRVNKNKQKQRAGETQLLNLKKERTRLEVEIQQFENSAMALGVIFGTTDSTPVEQLQTRHSLVKQEIEGLVRQSLEAEAEEEVVLTAHSITKSLIAENVDSISERKAVLEGLQEEVNILRNDQRLTDVSLDIDDNQLIEFERANRAELSALKGEIAINQTETAELKTQIAALRQESASHKSQITSLRSNVTNLQNTIAKITARLEECELPVDVSEKMMLKMREEDSYAQEQLLLLKESVSNLEIAVDTATTAAALTQLLKNVRSKELAVKAAEARRDIHLPWLKYFESLSRLLSTHQNEAIGNFTDEFGPLTSIIQRRLRSVYGFDDIEIQSQESTISVRVKRHGEELRPTDYFSQSQQQTLLLGLFLTACSSQTWSAFSTVFLDDPVTHFDDLNTYAFLDLIVGLLESDFGKRQFIISTCDEKLLQLSRQKFRHLGKGAKFYRFSSIGEDGPIVDEITTH